jgi:hypothetical protein
VLPADDVGREELADVGAAIGMSRHEGGHVALASTPGVRARASRRQLTEGWYMWLLDSLTHDRCAGQGSKTHDSSRSSWLERRAHPKASPANFGSATPVTNHETLF